MLSVVIPTRNRAGFLKDALMSILKQTLDPTEFEIIVVDNGSVDNTADIVARINSDGSRIRYLRAPEPGLHVGRHIGAENAVGEILVFADDDIIAMSGWLEAIRNTFKSGDDIALVGGKILPEWEAEIPRWVELFRVDTEYGWTIGHLSLLDFGDKTRDIPAGYVYGSNYSIKRNILWQCGGFHPDGMPQELIKYRGDGESALSREITKKGYRVVYEPSAVVYHRVPNERLSMEYFCRRAFNQGISDSYTEIRRNGGLNGTAQPEKKYGVISRILNLIRENPVKRKVRDSYLAGKEFHAKSVENDSGLLRYILMDTYFDSAGILQGSESFTTAGIKNNPS